MLKLLGALTLLFCTAATASITLVQAKANTACSGTTCAVTVTATGAGHTVIVGVAVSTNVTISSVTCAPTACTGGNAYTLCGTSCQTGNATTGFTDMAYTLNSASGDTTITMNLSGSPSGPGMAWEISATGALTFDVANKILDTTNCTSCAGVALTLTGTNDFIATLSSCGNTCSAISTYSADPATPWPGGDGMAHLLNTASGTAPNWTQSPTSNLASAAIAIKEASSGPPAGQFPRVN